MRKARRLRPGIEPLDARCLPTTITPAALASAYGFAAAASRFGAAARGAGIAIAVVDAYNDPRIQGELATFSRANGLPPANLDVINMGGTGDTAGLTGWSVETALDVEVIHALLPMAQIHLVQASSDSMYDLARAESLASSLPNVVAVSNSWGAYGLDSYNTSTLAAGFTTPGVVYAAAAGDSSGPIAAPASLPGVISVGGTVLKQTRHGFHQRPWLRYTTPPDVALVGGSPGVRAFAHGGFGAPPKWMGLRGTSLSTAVFSAMVGAVAGVRAGRGESPLGTAQFLAGMYRVSSTPALVATPGGGLLAPRLQPLIAALA